MTASSSLPSKQFVSTAWLAEHLDDPNVAIVDGSFYLAALKRDATAEYLAAHIPGAVQFDIDAIADHSTNLPHMLPSADVFAAAVGKLGIHDGMTIVVYDGAGLGGAPRVWWTFRVFGAENVLVLDGGLPKWKAEGRATESGARRQVGADRRCAPGGPFSWRSARAAPRPEGRPHAGRVQRADDHRGAEWPARIGRGARCRLRGRQGRYRKARDHKLRFGRDRRHSLDGARRARQGAEGALRRLLVRVGRA